MFRIAAVRQLPDWQVSFQYNSRLQPSQLYGVVNNLGNQFLYINALSWSTTNNNGTLQSVLEEVAASGNRSPRSSLTTFTDTYLYDSDNRLQMASEDGGWKRRFGYDNYGNMWVGVADVVPTGPGTAVTNTYDPATNRNYNEAYDNAGNQTTLGGIYTFAYDAENRQISENNIIGLPAAQYAYDGEGRRVQKTVGAATTTYVYDAMGQLAAEYTNSPGGTPPCGTCYLTYDHLGSTRMVTDENARVVSFHDYLPFGEEIPSNSLTHRSSLFGGSSDQVNQKFTGQERDPESGLDYFGARYYGSALGRFTSPDPIGVMKQKLLDPQQWNMYSYVRNNPLRFVDPTGMYLVNCPNGDKHCNKSADEFEKQRTKDLNSKNQKVRDAAGAWGDRGTDNHINVTFKPQAQIDADANTQPGHRTDAIVSAGPGADHKGNIQAEFSESLGGSALGQTIAHEGSHVEDDFSFLKSYDAATGRYNGNLNFTHRDTEFQAFETGAEVKAYTMFQKGLSGYQQLQDYIYEAYPNAGQVVFPPSTTFPQ